MLRSKVKFSFSLRSCLENQKLAQVLFHHLSPPQSTRRYHTLIYVSTQLSFYYRILTYAKRLFNCLIRLYSFLFYVISVCILSSAQAINMLLLSWIVSIIQQGEILNHNTFPLFSHPSSCKVENILFSTSASLSTSVAKCVEQDTNVLEGSRNFFFGGVEEFFLARSKIFFFQQVRLYCCCLINVRSERIWRSFLQLSLRIDWTVGDIGGNNRSFQAVRKSQQDFSK